MLLPDLIVSTDMLYKTVIEYLLLMWPIFYCTVAAACLSVFWWLLLQQCNTRAQIKPIIHYHTLSAQRDVIQFLLWWAVLSSNIVQYQTFSPLFPLSLHVLPGREACQRADEWAAAPSSESLSGPRPGSSVTDIDLPSAWALSFLMVEVRNKMKENLILGQWLGQIQVPWGEAEKAILIKMSLGKGDDLKQR